uniref:Uncharacterized protein n=1 Tax=Anguilla anguilla TaxID=7936 RepID=A0A0E9VRU9_ANGAN
MQMMSKTPRGTIYTRQQGQLTMVLWHDTKNSVISLFMSSRLQRSKQANCVSKHQKKR